MSESKPSIHPGLVMVFVILGMAACLILGICLGLAVGSFIGKSSPDFTDSAKYFEHQKVEVIEYEKRGKEVYLKFRNAGGMPVDDMYFEIEVRGNDGKLRQEYELNYVKEVAAGEVEETMLKPQLLEVDPIDLEGEIRVQYKYGWRTEVEQ